MKREVLLALNQAVRNGLAVVRAVDIASGDERVIDPAAESSAQNRRHEP